MSKNPVGRPKTIVSEHPLQHFTTRISAEAIEIAKAQNNTAAYVDEAIKEKNKKSLK